MIIGIEAQRAFRREKHGMDFVIIEAIRHMQRMQDIGHEIYVFVAPGPDRCLTSTPGVTIVELRCPSYPLWEQWALPRAARRYRLDLLHCTSNTAPLWCPVPLMVTLHDIIFMQPREGQSSSLYQNLGYHYRRFVVPRILEGCKAIVTVSDYERGNIVRRFPQVDARLHRIYNACSDHFRPSTARPGCIPEDLPPYFFFLGNTDPKKNTLRTLQAYRSYLQQSAVKRPLLIADLSEKDLSQILAAHGMQELRTHVHLTGYVPNQDLPLLYSQAFAMLYTSLRESFGIPLLEAMACGCPVVTSGVTSMPEIAADAALMADPTDAADIARAMLRLEQDGDELQRLRQAGPQRAALFSWEQTARELLRLYDVCLRQ